jgi:hypothetical protein
MVRLDGETSTTLATSLPTFHRAAAGLMRQHAASATPEEFVPSRPRAKDEPRPEAPTRGEGE